MIDIIKTYIKYVLLHRFNKVNKQAFNFLDKHFMNKKHTFLKVKLYNKIKKINKNNTENDISFFIGIDNTKK